MNELHGAGLTISCDDCSMRRTTACNECVVTFLLDGETGDHAVDHPVEHDPLVLDLDQARVVRLLGRAGLVPDLKYRVAG